jgi:hypothetical protein
MPKWIIRSRNVKKGNTMAKTKYKHCYGYVMAKTGLETVALIVFFYLIKRATISQLGEK